MTAAARWAEELARWAIPDRIKARAPEDPWGFPLEVFEQGAREALAVPPSPTHRRVVQALPVGGVLLDVGCGAGAASLPVAPPASRIVAVDQDARMLTTLQELGAGRAEIRTVHGSWPDVAEQAGVADVVVCSHVLYNVANLPPFLEALTRAARNRVVVELTAVHPQTALNRFWRHFWDLDRPTGPTAADAADVVREVTGSEVASEQWQPSHRFMDGRDSSNIPWLRRRLCLPASADPEIAKFISTTPEPAATASVTFWWHGTGGSGR